MGIVWTSIKHGLYSLIRVTAHRKNVIVKHLDPRPVLLLSLRSVRRCPTNKTALAKLLAMLIGGALCGCKAELNTGATPAALNTPPPPQVSADPGPAPADQLLWGDLHVHSNVSFDAFSFGNRELSPSEAFAFARGEAVTASSGQKAQLERPLDFLLVSDHAEYMGVMRELIAGNPTLLNAEFAQRWKKLLDRDELGVVLGEFTGSIERTSGQDNRVPDAFVSDIWREVVSAAEQYNQPGTFTAFIGYEWTSMIDGRNLHRNVIFRDGPDKALQHRPFSSIAGRIPEELWAALQDYTDTTGGQVMAIPHNGNLSNGLMFAEAQGNGEVMTADYARLRQHWEPLYEVTQVKGDSEAHPLLSPDDPFADFENWDETDIAMQPKAPDQLAAMVAHEYARPALRAGLRLESRLGSNPFKFGLIGSTDSHTALATADSAYYFGKFPDSEPGVARLTNKMGGALWANRNLVASGYTGVWANANTRESIFNALRRREVYATTGPRIAARLFGGWHLPRELSDAADAVEQAYQLGVPMGSDLPDANSAEATPGFLVIAEKDPQGANLDRLQLVKGWLDENGQEWEKVYEVAWSDERVLQTDGRLPALPSTVNTGDASYADSVGAARLATVWYDLDFNRSQPAFYYLRVLQIETPRWTTYDAARYGSPLPADLPAAIQERAYTSPIWYNPE